MLAIILGATTPLVGQNLYLQNLTDCNYTVNVRFADVNCDYTYYPEYTPSTVCNENVDGATYSAPHLVNSSYTTPHSSQICTVNVFDEYNNLVASCSCGQVNCHVDDLPCMTGYIDIDITITQYTTTIKWLP